MMKIGKIEDMGYDLPYDTFEVKEWELFKVSYRRYVSYGTPTKDRLKSFKKRKHYYGNRSDYDGDKKSKGRVLRLKGGDKKMTRIENSMRKKLAIRKLRKNRTRYFWWYMHHRDE